jgi:pSer/pThr/pTyr-binding forkhead associated (FHA) protein
VRLVFEGATPPAQDREPTEGTATIARRLVEDLFDASSVVAVTAGASPQRLVLAEEGRLYVVGRADTCALPLDVEHVSREHAAFLRTPAGVILRDLGSKNGVLVNATRITSDHLVSDADQIQIGPVTLTLEDTVSRYLRELEEKPAPDPEPLAEPARAPTPPVTRASAFSRLTTTVAVGVLATIAVLAVALLR